MSERIYLPFVFNVGVSLWRRIISRYVLAKARGGRGTAYQAQTRVSKSDTRPSKRPAMKESERLTKNVARNMLAHTQVQTLERVDHDHTTKKTWTLKPRTWAEAVAAVFLGECGSTAARCPPVRIGAELHVWSV